VFSLLRRTVLRELAAAVAAAATAARSSSHNSCFKEKNEAGDRELIHNGIADF
jgi:hypothetical protein